MQTHRPLRRDPGDVADVSPGTRALVPLYAASVRVASGCALTFLAASIAFPLVYFLLAALLRQRSGDAVVAPADAPSKLF